MKAYIHIMLIFMISLLASGCGGSVPPCDSKEVKELLIKILDDADMALISNGAISTTKSDDKSRICKSVMKVKNKQTKEQEEVGVQYEINLADNKKEFAVTLRLE